MSILSGVINRFPILFSPLNTTGERGNSGLKELFKRKRKTRAWARYWSLVNRHIYQTASRFRDNCMVIRYEDLCSRSYEVLRKAADLKDSLMMRQRDLQRRLLLPLTTGLTSPMKS